MGESRSSTGTIAHAERGRNIPWFSLVLLGGVVAWSFTPTFIALFQKWDSDPQYSHGFLVPAFSLFLLWTARKTTPVETHAKPVAGGLILLGAVLLRTIGGLRYHEWLESISLLPTLAGVVVMLGGWSWLRWSLPAIGFLGFMVPLPYRVEVMLGGPLQNLATIASTFVLQTFGQPAIAEGNTILMRDVRLGIVEACSGLRMLVTFFTFSTAVCLVVKKPLSDKMVILFSAIPIALIVNIIRIVSTGVMHLYFNSEWANKFYHDLAGWFMMPMALAMLWMELWMLRRLIIETPTRSIAR